MYYAGIGSRNTPKEVLDAFEYLGKELGQRGFILRSGGANGADSAFEKGCDSVGGDKEIYLPWKDFNGNKSPRYVYQNGIEAAVLAMEYHPNFQPLKPAAKSLIMRDGYQVLGEDLNTPSDVVICYTEGGAGGGGTGQAIRNAKGHNIKICDFGRWPKEQAMEIAKKLVNTLEKMFALEEEREM